ncbi:hypothetical protein TPAU25S_03426 [Tsukamurella paurometabola]|nr:Uncharacterised protein [Tsukamurella paurometabola]
MQERAGTHRRPDTVHTFTGETRVEQPQQIVGEGRPAVVLRDGAPGRAAVTARVVAQQPGTAQTAPEIEIEDSIARPAGCESVKLYNGVSALVTEFGVERGAGNVESGHRAFSQRAGGGREG